MRRAALLFLAGLSFVAVMPVVSMAQTAAVEQPPVRGPFDGFIAEAARSFGLPAPWIRAVIAAESDGDPRATSPKGAMGLMQIMPATWSELRAVHRLGSDPYDPRDNILAGAAYMRTLLDRYGSPGWIAAYNAGPGRYEASLRGRPLPAETRAYVAAIAPSIEGPRTTGLVQVATAGLPNWARAPLFIVQQDRSGAAGPLPPKGSANDSSAVSWVRDISAIGPQSAGLFVAATGAGAEP